MKEKFDTKEIKRRYGLLDSIRGLVLISMIIYHSCWDLVYIFGKDWSWYKSTGAYVWQQSICWSFIFLSGFCWSLGKKHIRRGMVIFGSGVVVSLVTIFFMPENRVVFGVLTLIGSSMILLAIVDKAVQRVPARAGFLLSGVLFLLTRNLNEGYLGFERWNLVKLPVFLYQGSIMTFLGFTESEFYSTDYFSLFPWFFLYLTGYFLYGMVKKKNAGEFMKKYFVKGWEPLSFPGRHSLIIYLMHQPLIYGILMLIF